MHSCIFVFFVDRSLQTALLELIDQILTGPVAERENGQRHVLIPGGDKTTAVHDKQIPHVVRLAEGIEDRSLRIGTHAGCAGFVDTSAWIGQLPIHR